MLNEFDDLFNDLFKSETIKPTFEPVHILLALLLFEDHPNGLGRYKLKEELLIGSGTARSLINKLRKKINFLTIPDESQRTGHVLTENGKNFLNTFKASIPLLVKGDINAIKNIVIESENQNAYLCFVRNAGTKITNGIAQRDAAIKVDGSGATCLIYDGNRFSFPSLSVSEEDKDKMSVDEQVQGYMDEIAKNHDIKLEKDDVIIIGLAEKEERARLAALNSALTLI